MDERFSTLLSVIVPVYNSKQFLPKCIDSILAQRYKDFELILINDGSTDGSAEICDRYSENDARVKVIHQQNSGVSNARNKGIAYSMGSFITFCDSDDWIHEDYFSALMAENECDLIICSYNSFVKNTVKEVILPQESLAGRREIGDFFVRHMFVSSVCFSSPWGKRFKRDLINQYNLSFDSSISSGEDTIWVFSYYAHVDSLKVLEFAGYYYRQYYSVNQLSAAPLDKATIDYTFQHLFGKIDELELRYSIQLISYRYHVLLTYFQKFAVYLSSVETLKLYKELKRISLDPYFYPLWEDTRFVSKGERRKVFDWLVLNKCYLLLTLYIKAVRPVY